MTNEVKLRIAALRWAHFHEDCTDANDTCPVRDECSRFISMLCDLRITADLIESIVAELEQVKFERDAAVEDIPKECHKCKHFKVLFNGCTLDYDCEYSDVCEDGDRWQWRGVKEDT